MGTAILSLLCDGQRSPDQALSASVRRPSANDGFILEGIWLYNLLLSERLRRALGVRPSAELGRSPRSNVQSSRPAVFKTFRSAGLLSSASESGHRFILGETWLYNLLLPDHRLRRALGVRPSAELGRSPRSNAQSSRPAVSKTFRSAGLLSSASKSGHRFILGETWLYNLLPPDHSPAAFRRFRGAGLSSSASKSVKRSLYMLKRCLLSFFSAVLSDW